MRKLTRGWVALGVGMMLLGGVGVCGAQSSASSAAKLAPLPAPQNVPQPGAVADGPYQPTAIVQGGVVVTLYPAGSTFLNQKRVKEAEQYSMSQAVPGRINSIVNIHNPSIEVHTVDGGINTGTAVILVAGGGHRTLNVGGEGADFVPFFLNYGVNTVIVRNRLRRDGYDVPTDATYDVQQAIRMVRAHAADWKIDPHKIGVMGFSAGAELASGAAVFYDRFDKANGGADDPLAGVSSRPDFVALVYPGPTPFAPDRTAPPVPKNAPPTFLICGGSDDQIHALWADDYFRAFLKAGVPNLEMHIYGNGRHPGDPLRDGTHMSGGLTDRNGIPFGTWQFRFVDWFRDLGYLGKAGVETKADKDVEYYVSQPVKGAQ